MGITHPPHVTDTDSEIGCVATVSKLEPMNPKIQHVTTEPLIL